MINVPSHGMEVNPWIEKRRVLHWPCSQQQINNDLHINKTAFTSVILSHKIFIFCPPHTQPIQSTTITIPRQVGYRERIKKAKKEKNTNNQKMTNILLAQVKFKRNKLHERYPSR